MLFSHEEHYWVTEVIAAIGILVPLLFSGVMYYMLRRHKQFDQKSRDEMRAFSETLRSNYASEKINERKLRPPRT